jgi:adenosylcobyric acid synthase
VRDDLAFLREQQWDAQLLRHLRYGGKVLGICGGFQMLGREIRDPRGIESAPGYSAGLGLLDMHTELYADKQLQRVQGRLALDGAAVSGYEIHCGLSAGPALQRPAAHLDGRDDGAVSADGQIIGTYLHGLFDQPAACDALLRWAGLHDVRSPDYPALREAQLDRLADALERHLDLAALLS